MKRFILLTTLILGYITTGYCQSDQVTFIHGLRDNSSVWNTMANQLAEEFDFARDNVNYNSELAVSTSASNIFIPNGTVTVAHSLGGLLAREYLRQGNPNDMKALITVGTPHLGAPVAATVQNGKAAQKIAGWIEDLAAGPATLLGSIAGREYAKFVLENIGIVSRDAGFLLKRRLEAMFGNVASVDNMKPNSSFLNTLNTAPNNTLPSARYAIFGAEKGLEYIRLAESFIRSDSGNPLERGTGIIIHHSTSALYFFFASRFAYLAGKYWYLYYQTDYTDSLHYFYQNNALYFTSLAHAWFRGFFSLIYIQQREWDQDIIGVNYYTGSICGDADICKDANDGLLPARTQAPLFFGTVNDRVLRADGANHIEETVHPNVKQRLIEIFNKENIPPVDNSGPLTVTVSGLPYVNDGQTATFSANVSNAEGSVSYQWYYRQESWSSWVADGSNSPSYQHTFYSAPGGETAHSAVKVEISSAGETASDIHSVDVYGCQGSGLQSQSISTNIIIPCSN